VGRKLTNSGGHTPDSGTVDYDSLTSSFKTGVYRKNMIINGNFDIWQRATSQTNSGYGSVDRWINDNLGSTKTTSQQPFTIGQTDVPNNPSYYIRTVTTSVTGVNNRTLILQNIENVATLAGKSITISFWAKADATKTLATEFSQNFGTGGSPSTSVSTGITQHTLTTTWQKFTVTATLPSVSGKTIGTNNNSKLQVAFWFDAGTTFNSRTDSLGHQSGTFDIAQVQIEENNTATEFENRSIGTEFTLCVRYYYKNTIPTQYATVLSSNTGSTFRRLVCPFPEIMRAAPSVTVTSPTISTGAFTSQFPSSITETGFLWIGDAAVSSANTHIKGYTADAEL
jgi:hypothetical protein